MNWKNKKKTLPLPLPVREGSSYNTYNIDII